MHVASHTVSYRECERWYDVTPHRIVIISILLLSIYWKQTNKHTNFQNPYTYCVLLVVCLFMPDLSSKLPLSLLMYLVSFVQDTFLQSAEWVSPSPSPPNQYSLNAFKHSPLPPWTDWLTPSFTFLIRTTPHNMTRDCDWKLLTHTRHIQIWNMMEHDGTWWMCYVSMCCCCTVDQ